MKLYYTNDLLNFSFSYDRGENNININISKEDAVGGICKELNIEPVLLHQHPYANNYTINDFNEDDLFLINLSWAKHIYNIDRQKKLKGFFYNHTDYSVDNAKMCFGDHYINNVGKFYNYGELETFGHIYNDEPIFIKPNLGNKAFTGFVADSVDDARNELGNYNLNENMIVHLSSPKKLSPIEYRFWIVDGKIATHSTYTNKGVNVFNEDDYKLFNHISFAREMMDRFNIKNYTLDVCHSLLTQELKVIEVNCLNTSALYMCDLEKLLVAYKGCVTKKYHIENNNDLKEILSKVELARRQGLFSVVVDFPSCNEYQGITKRCLHKLGYEIYYTKDKDDNIGEISWL